MISTTTFAQQGQMPNLDDVFFKQFDADQDGQVSKQEFMKPTEAQFEHMDKNGDGALNRAEVKAFNDEMQQRMREMQQRMQQSGGHAPGMPPPR
jgi:Ca2+-binding EF-hand superfamily protein